MSGARLRRGAAGWRDQLVPPPGTARLCGAALADAVGTGLFLSGAVVFFTRRLGLDAVTISTGLAVAGAVALLAVTPLGMLTDRIGYALTLRTAHFARAAVYPLYLLVDGAAGFVVLVTAITVADRLAAPVFQAVVGAAVGDARRSETMGYVRALRNAGFSLGALLTSLALASDTAAGYDALALGNGLSFLLAGALLLRVPNVRAPRPDGGGPRLRGIRPRYLALAALNVVLALHDTILQLALPLVVLHQTGVPPAVLPPLFVLNTVLVLLLQRRVSRGTATAATAARAELSAAWYLAGCCACLAAAALLPVAGAAAALVVGVVLLTVGESQQIAGAWELSHRHAPASARAAHLAVFSIGIGVQRSVGPGVVSLVALGGPVVWAPVAAALLVAGAAARRLGSSSWSPSTADAAGPGSRIRPVGGPPAA